MRYAPNVPTIVLLCLLTGLMGCSETTTTGTGDAPDTIVGDAPEEDTGPGSEPTWYQHVQPLVAASCRPCHYVGGPASFAMDSYANTKPWAPVMATYAEQRIMPPFAVDDSDECSHAHGFLNDRRLEDAEIALLRSWADAGAPEGDPATAAPAPTPPPPTLDNPSTTIALADQGYSWSVTADQIADDHRCFSLDLGLTQDTWLDAVEVVAGGETGKRSIVHHAVLFMDPQGASAGLATDAGGSYSCPAGPGVADWGIVGVWTPGIQPFQTPPDSAFQTPSGARLIVQVHYHPQGEANTDTTTAVRLRYRQGAPALIAEMRNIGALVDAPGLQPGPNDPNGVEFLIPNGAVDHTETMIIDLPVPPGVDVRVWAQFPHMHYVGTDLLATIERAGGGEECSIHAPRYDFNWQGIYQYDAPVDQLPQVFSGDRMRLRCTYTNDATKNPQLAVAIANDALLSETADVHVGEGTLDEMCLVITGIVYPNPNAP